MRLFNNLISLKNILANSRDGLNECPCLNLSFNIALENDMQTQMGCLEFNTKTILAVSEDIDNKINWPKLQRNDPILTQVINWVETQKRPSLKETCTIDAEERAM